MRTVSHHPKRTSEPSDIPAPHPIQPKECVRRMPSFDGLGVITGQLLSTSSRGAWFGSSCSSAKSHWHVKTET
jgi:hypothetical protein